MSMTIKMKKVASVAALEPVKSLIKAGNLTQSGFVPLMFWEKLERSWEILSEKELSIELKKLNTAFFGSTAFYIIMGSVS